MEDNILKLAIDIGNSKIKFIIGELNTNGTKLRILDYLEVPSEGIKKSVIESQELLSNSINVGLNELKRRNGIEFESAAVGISCEKTMSRTKFGYIEFEEKKITQDDIKKLVNSVAKEILTDEEFIIEEAVYNIRINNSGILKNPIGQTGNRLQGNVHLVTIKREYLNPVLRTLAELNLEVESIHLNASASAKATLSNEDRQMGVAIIDIGEGITDVAIYKNDKIIYTKSLNIGGMHYVNDIKFILGVAKKEAEIILDKVRKKEIENGFVKTEIKTYEYETIKGIIEARTEDLIKFISKTIDESGFTGYLGKGMVFTGGTVSIDEIIAKIGKDTDYHVKKIKPIPLKGLENPEPRMSSVVGVLLDKLEEEFKIREEKKLKKENEVSLKNEDSLNLELSEVIKQTIKINQTFANNSGYANKNIARNKHLETKAEEEVTEELSIDAFFQEDFEPLEVEEAKNKKQGFFSNLRKMMSNFI